MDYTVRKSWVGASMIEILFIIFMIVFFISSNNIEKSLKRTEEQNKQIIQLLKEKQEKEWGVGASLFFVFLIDEEGKVILIGFNCKGVHRCIEHVITAIKPYPCGKWFSLIGAE